MATQEQIDIAQEMAYAARCSAADAYMQSLSGAAWDPRPGYAKARVAACSAVEAEAFEIMTEANAA